MKIFLDTAKIEEIQLANNCGIVDGVTTNPSLMKKAVDDMVRLGQTIKLQRYIEEILREMKGKPVSLEVTGMKSEEMIEQGKRLYKLFNPVANNVYIKIPVNPSMVPEPSTDGIRAIKALSGAGIPVNCTLVFTPEQALLAAKAGASFVSPFAGRIDDYLREKNGLHFNKTDYFPAAGIRAEENIVDDNGIVSGIDLVRQIAEMFRIHHLKTEVLAASLRNARQVREAALAGAHIATVPFPVFKELFTHLKTQEGMKLFAKDVVPEYDDLTR